MFSAVRTDGAPAPVGPYSQAVVVGETVYCSGQIGLDPLTGTLVEGSAGAQARQCMANLGAVLAAAGTSLAGVVKTTIFLTDMADFPEVNAAYALSFPSVPPARSTVAVAALPLGAKVEVEAVAVRSSR